MLVRIKTYLAIYKPSHIAKLNQTEALMLISHKVKSPIQKIRIGFGEMDLTGRIVRTGISSILSVG